MVAGKNSSRYQSSPRSNCSSWLKNGASLEVGELQLWVAGQGVPQRCGSGALRADHKEVEAQVLTLLELTGGAAAPGLELGACVCETISGCSGVALRLIFVGQWCGSSISISLRRPAAKV